MPTRNIHGASYPGGFVEASSDWGGGVEQALRWGCVTRISADFYRLSPHRAIPAANAAPLGSGDPPSRRR